MTLSPTMTTTPTSANGANGARRAAGAVAATAAAVGLLVGGGLVGSRGRIAPLQALDDLPVHGTLVFLGVRFDGGVETRRDADVERLTVGGSLCGRHG